MLSLTMLSSITHAQPQLFCLKENPADELERDHDEYLRIQAITDGGFLFSIYVSEKGTYSIVLMPPDVPDLYCVGGSGIAFSLIEKKNKVGGAD